MSPSKLIKKNLAGGYMLVEITGTLVYEDVNKVSEEIKGLFAEGHDKIIIDLSGITHVNSKGIGALISVKASAGLGSRQFVILNPSQDVVKILTITKLLDIFTVCKNIEEAKRLLK